MRMTSHNHLGDSFRYKTVNRFEVDPMALLLCLEEECPVMDRDSLDKVILAESSSGEKVELAFIPPT
ncbi:hypothetical protein TNCV_2892991 [Trichonephila clavipes]|nr:hypothetical protein TNCV_2892991 [Trichonephila clavipes]